MMVKKFTPVINEAEKIRSTSCLCDECGRRNLKYFKINTY